MTEFSDKKGEVELKGAYQKLRGPTWVKVAGLLERIDRDNV